ncbi:MAG: 50S ribosomal protein L9 [Verrucomicrobiae bacterium]|nr:50S ribosomal protein L9 [Verrucomicrobiae bacterium]
MLTKLILTANIPTLGAEGDQVSVASGYARNYLVPKKLAVMATAAAMKRIESLKLLRAERERKELEQAQELAGKIAKFHNTVELQTAEDGKLFGSVTNADIATALASRGYEIDRRSILLENPIRKVGVYEIEIRLHQQVTTKFKLTVVSANQPTPQAAKEDDPKAKKGKGAAKGAVKSKGAGESKPARKS